ncbi:MAG: secretin N-terminal domain-containing protein [Candidatus Sumerlaeia bacterium]
MFTSIGKGLRIGALIALLAISSAWAQDGALGGDTGTTVPLLMINQDSKSSSLDSAERIQVTFGESEKDLLTREAVQKLEAPIESLEFSNADLRNVIRIIGERLNINFIFDANDINGNITLRLRNIRLRDALDSILKTRKLAIIVDPSGIFRIVPQEQINRKTIETRTEVIQLNWIRAEDVAKTMKPFLSSDTEGRLVPNTESNSVIITDVPPQIEVVRKLIKQIDVPERQVMIEARLVDINIGALKDFQTDISVSKLNDPRDWQTGVPYQDENNETKYATIPLQDTLGVVDNLLEGASVKGGVGTVALGDTISILGERYNLNAVFTALETRQIVQVLANPKVSTLNNLKAVIDITKKIPYTNANNDAGGQTTVMVEFQDSGIKIGVTPNITPNGFVRMNIDLSQKLDRGRAATATSLNPMPAHLIDERNATTNVIVSSGATAVLGGLRQLDTSERVDGVPWLHRVPVLGWLFKNKNFDQSKVDLLLMMTPTIVDENQRLTDKEKSYYGKIDTEWKLPDYMMDDVANQDDLSKQDGVKKNEKK